jgi:hypothetical protein
MSLSGICSPTITRQVFSPGKVIFAGVGVLLLVRTLFDIMRHARVILIPILHHSGSKGYSEKPRNTH